MLCVLRQLRSKDGGGLGAVPCRATPRGAWPGAAFCTTAVNLRQIEFDEFGGGSAKNTGRARITILRNCNPLLYQLRHTYIILSTFLTQDFLYYTAYYTIPYYTILLRSSGIHLVTYSDSFCLSAPPIDLF